MYQKFTTHLISKDNRNPSNSAMVRRTVYNLSHGSAFENINSPVRWKVIYELNDSRVLTEHQIYQDWGRSIEKKSTTLATCWYHPKYSSRVLLTDYYKYLITTCQKILNNWNHLSKGFTDLGLNHRKIWNTDFGEKEDAILTVYTVYFLYFNF